jgi:PAS domain S-box-containing protein
MAQPPAETLELLLEAGRLLSSKLELDDLLRSVLELSSRVVDAESASLLLLDEKTGELYFDVALGLGEKASKIRLPLGQGVAGSVAKSLEPAVINDVRADPRWSPKMDEQSGFVTRSILAVPLTLKGRLLGVVEAINRKSGSFTPQDLRTFEAFASQAAVAIENARLFTSLRDEKLKLDTIFTEMTDAAVLCDHEGFVLLANKAARRFFGLGPERTNLPEALKGLEVSPSLREVMDNPDAGQDLRVMREEPKRLVLQGRATRIRGGRGERPGLLCVFRDVTDEIQKEGIKHTFLSLISHKLKTPLSAVMGFSEILMLELKDRPAALRAARSVSQQGRKLAGLVDNLIHYTTLEDPGMKMEFKACGVDDLVAEAVKRLQDYLGECGGDVEHVRSGLLVTGDQSRLVDVLKNLIENAVKFNVKERKNVRVWSEPDGPRVLIHVVDEGPGIPPEDQDKIFSQFHQVEASFTGQVEGWGLGLAYSRKVAGLHSGELRLASKLGQGTTFTLHLPGAKS